MIPRNVIEYFLIGKTSQNEPERYTQDGGITLDVWIQFGKDLKKSQEILLAPADRVSTVHLGSALHEAMRTYRDASNRAARDLTCIAPLETYVTATVYLDELLHVVLPLTSWWKDRNLRAIRWKELELQVDAADLLKTAIKMRLVPGPDVNLAHLRSGLTGKPPDQEPHWRILDAAPIAALVGVFAAARTSADFERELEGAALDHQRFEAWLRKHATEIAHSAVSELAREFGPIFKRAEKLLPGKRDRFAPPAFIQRVFRDRTATLAAVEPAVSTVKADAARRVFDLSCKEITWGVIDAGIASRHPAFLDHEDEQAQSKSRVRQIYDLTRIKQVRTFDLVDAPKERLTAIVDGLAKLGARAPNFKTRALRNLKLIAKELEREMQPDWGLLEPLLHIESDDDAKLFSDHGTHVAGTLGGDWRGPDGKAALQGICPDINLVDLRVVTANDVKATESSLVAALEFVQFLNRRSRSRIQAIHGVNISLSIPHDGRLYGCGATPVCVEADRLSSSGVVVVAAAGNRGWNEQELGFGNNVLSSITDPGNAHQVITVGATHASDPHTYGVSYFSSRGPTGDGRLKPDLVAPGERIRGPIQGDADAQLDGTSMASPFVSGAAAMLLARYRELIGKPERVKEILLASATDLGRERYFQGRGLVDVLRALQSL